MSKDDYDALTETAYLDNRVTSLAFATTSPVVDRVGRQHDRVIITHNGHDAAVVISTEDLAQLEETIAVLSDPDALPDIPWGRWLLMPETTKSRLGSYRRPSDSVLDSLTDPGGTLGTQESSGTSGLLGAEGNSGTQVPSGTQVSSGTRGHRGTSQARGPAKPRDHIKVDRELAAPPVRWRRP